jgi:hypothetical protein
MAARREDLDTGQLAAGYEAGESIRQLADRWATSYSTVYGRLTAAGVHLRDRSAGHAARRARTPQRRGQRGRPGGAVAGPTDVAASIDGAIRDGCHSHR